MTSDFGKICAVVIAYNTQGRFDKALNSLKGQVDHVLLVNTSMDGGVTRGFLEVLQQDNPGFVTLVECPENNLGMGQNQGLRFALENGYEWAMLLDHDSRPESGMIAAMQEAYQHDKNRDNIAIIAPNLYDAKADTPHHYITHNTKWKVGRPAFDKSTPIIDNVLCVAASGSLIPVRILEEIGMLEEDFMVDYIDTEFCLRLAAKGHRIIAVRDAVLNHRFGGRKIHSILGLKIATTHHPAFRRYYFYRNRILTWKRHAKTTPSFVLFDALRMFSEITRITLLETQKWAKLTSAFRGIRDGFASKTGAQTGIRILRHIAS